MILLDRVGKFSREVLLAHELTHALQYQNFPIRDALDKSKATYDRYLAFNAILEGDATLTSLAYEQGRSFDKDAAKKIETRLRNALSATEPPPLDEMIEYYYGTVFVIEAFERGGWDGVNRLYSRPPESTREIMEPELYFARDHPSEASDFIQPAWAGWTEVDRNTLGVAPLIAMTVRGTSGSDRVAPMKIRWTSDRLIAFEKSGQLAIVWMIAFDDSDAAWAFEQSYRPILDHASAARPHHIDRTGNTVIITIGAEAQYAALQR